MFFCYKSKKLILDLEKIIFDKIASVGSMYPAGMNKFIYSSISGKNLINADST
jgi:hypothetical protein